MTPTHDSGGSGQKTVGRVLAGVGVIGLGVGIAIGVMAKSANDSTFTLCPGSGPTCSNCKGVDDTNCAKTLGTLSTLGFLGGGVLLAAAVVVWLTAPTATGTGANHPTKATIRARGATRLVHPAPTLSSHYSGVSFEDSFE